MSINAPVITALAKSVSPMKSISFNPFNIPTPILLTSCTTDSIQLSPDEAPLMPISIDLEAASLTFELKFSANADGDVLLLNDSLASVLLSTRKPIYCVAPSADLANTDCHEP